MKKSTAILYMSAWIILIATGIIALLSGCAPSYDRPSWGWSDSGGGDPTAFVGLMSAYGQAHRVSMSHCYVGPLGNSLSCNSW
jgi:hypothetical protein